MLGHFDCEVGCRKLIFTQNVEELFGVIITQELGWRCVDGNAPNVQALWSEPELSSSYA